MQRYPFTFISDGYFETLGIPLIRGRDFTAQEITNQAPVAIISDLLARQLWPDENPIGKRVTIGSRTQTRLQFQAAPFFESSEVVGIARDVYSETMTALDPGAVYLPRQTTDWGGNLFLRTQGEPRAVSAALAGELQNVNRNLSVSLQTMESILNTDGSFLATTIFGVVFSVVGLLGLVLATVGIYSMVGYAVSQQTREVGIRMAMGARRSDILRMIVGRVMRPMTAGLSIGLIFGVVLSLWLSSVFHGLKHLDAGVLIGISILFTLIATVAAYIPARKAVNLDPSVALRSE